MNGLANANEILGEEAFKPDDWRADGEYIFDDQGRRHQAFYYPVRETTALGAVVRPHERVQIEQSLKYSPHEAKKLWHSAGMAEIARWQAKEHGQCTMSFFSCSTSATRVGGQMREGSLLYATQVR